MREETKKKYLLSDTPAKKIDFGPHTQVATSIASIVCRPEGIRPPFVIGLFGPWGSGKSTVLKKLEELLHKPSLKSIPIYIDVWKHSQESFLRALISAVIDSNGISNCDKDEFREKIGTKTTVDTKGWTLGWKIWSIVIITCIVLMLPFLLYLFYSVNPQSVKNAPDWMVKFFIFGLLALVTNILLTLGKRETTYKREPTNLDDPAYFRDTLVALLNKIHPNQLCILIDNLDRCLPDDAVGIMRRIKTFMIDESTSPKLSFVVACDDLALEKHLEAIFKLDSDDGTENTIRVASREFLRKFFNILIRIPGIHRSDMQQFIAGELQSVFGHEDSYIKLNQEKMKQVRNVIFAAYSENPRQVKQFINKLASRLYVLKELEEAQKIKSVSPTSRPEIVALYIAATSQYKLDFVAALTALQNATDGLGKLSDLNLHSGLNRQLWAAIHFMVEPNTIQTYPDIADLVHALETENQDAFYEIVSKGEKEEASEKIEQSMLELASLGETFKERKSLFQFLMAPDIRNHIAPTDSIAQFVTRYLRTSDPHPGWEINSQVGESIAYYLKPFPKHVIKLIAILDGFGSITKERISEKTYYDIVVNISSVITPRQLSSLISRGLSAFPSLIKILSNNPEALHDDHVENISKHWQLELAAISDLLQSKKAPTTSHEMLVEAAFQWPSAPMILNAQSIPDFIQKDGLKLVNTLIGLTNLIDQPQLTQLQQTISRLIQFLNQITDNELIYDLLDMIGKAMDAEEQTKLQFFEPNIKNQLPTLVWQVLPKLSGTVIIELLTSYPMLGEISPQQNLISLAQQKPETYDTIMRNFALPKGWFSTLASQSVNPFEQWLGAHWKELTQEERSKLQGFVLNQWASNIGRPQGDIFRNLIAKMPPEDEELISARYALIVNHASQLFASPPLNTAEGFKNLLSLINGLTGMSSPIPQQLVDLVETYRKQVPHTDLSSVAKGLKTKWGKALKANKKKP